MGIQKQWTLYLNISISKTCHQLCPIWFEHVTTVRRGKWLKPTKSQILFHILGMTSWNSPIGWVRFDLASLEWNKSWSIIQYYGTFTNKRRDSFWCFGKVPFSKYNTYIFTAIDMFLKFLFTLPIPNSDSLTVSQAIFQAVCTFRVCDCIISDRGSEFISQCTDYILWNH
jgi:hypothetical protein